MPRGALVCVYRARNVGLVLELVQQARRAGLSTHLWALDREAPELVHWTRGVGPGARLELLNRLTSRTRRDGPLVVADDDVSFSSGDLRRLLRIARLGRLDLCQPAHDGSSAATHWITGRHPESIARRTKFVEVGPLLVISRRLRPLVTPFPEQYGMGWGLDVVWSDLVSEGWHLGVVDRVTVTHHGAVGADYDTASSESLLADELAERGLTDMTDLNANLAYWPYSGRWDPRNAVPRWSHDRPVRRPRLVGRALRLARVLGHSGDRRREEPGSP